ncbi:MAG: hypothetical protein IIA59_11635 [Candidatus Marinimicrobia bacterium]|nr:hypothetical protein [Candidatus Neomarinimicrobiota bacterium]
MKPRPYILICLLLAGCTLQRPDESKLPIWSASFDMPLIDMEITLDVLLEDSLITTAPYGSGDERIYVFSKSVQLERIAIGNHLKANPVEQTFVHYASAVSLDSTQTRFSIGLDPATLSDITKAYGADIGLIRLDNISPEETEDFLFSEIMPEALISALDSAIMADGGGTTVLIDTLDLVPSQKALAFDSFRWADVSSGFLDVTLINDMFLPLGAPIVIDVKDSLGVLLFRMTWPDEIAVGDSATLTQDLSELVVALPGNLLIEVSGRSNGSGGSLVTVTNEDLSSSFRTRVTAREVQVTRTDAKVPAQTITDSSASALDPSDTVVEEALLLTAQMEITAENGTPLSGAVTLHMPGLYFQSRDSLFTLTFNLVPGPNTTIPTTDLSGWSIVMDPSNQELKFNYNLVTEATAPDFVILDQFDRVDFNLSITNISISELTGTLATQTVSDSGDIAIESDSRIQTASISAGALVLSILNRVGGSADVHLVVPELLRTGLPLDTVLFMGSATTVHTIGLAGYIVQPVSIDDQRVTYTMQITTRNASGSYFLLDSIDVNVALDGLEFDAITGFISQAVNITEDFISLDSGTAVESARIDSGAIRVTIRNEIGLSAELLIEIDDMVKNGAPLSFVIPVTSETTPQTFNLDVSGYTLSLSINDQRLRYRSTLTVPDTTLLTLSLADSITATVLVDTLWFGSLTGIIDTVEIEIDTVEQRLPELPSALDYFDFTEAQIRLNFDSDLTLPVYLSTTLTAYAGDGSVELTSVENWNITDSASVNLPDASRLINIRPERIIVVGTARLGGDGTVGSVAAAQSLGGTFKLTAPMVLTIDSGATITTTPYQVTGINSSPQVTEGIEQVQLFISYRNDFDFGTSLAVYMSLDTSLLAAGLGSRLIDSLTLKPRYEGLDSLLLTDERLDLFNQSGMYIQARLRVLSLTDSDGTALPITFLSTDTLRLNLSGRVQYLMDGAKLAGGSR